MAQKQCLVDCWNKRDEYSRKAKEKFVSVWNNLTLVIYTKALCRVICNGFVAAWKWLRPHLPKNKVNFLSLTPTDKAKNIEVYSEALTQALLNENIYNIAVTGAYGSGKSSFLKTYFNDRPSLWPFGGKKNKRIQVSLANLADKAKKKQSEVTIQEIEVSILHQLFFHERSGVLTDSHFTKIQQFGFWKLSRYACYLMLYLVSCVHLVKAGFWTKILRLQSLPWDISPYRDYWHWGLVAIAIAGTMFVLYQSVRVIAQFAVQKLTISSAASIEIHSKQEKSILNAHIDEIIYFFSVTGYNIVLIEDLDRFKQPSIFVKLREINYLINNSKEVKQRVRFIYALGDEMFKDEEVKTKFFDFIIPIIPIVDASNSGKMLRKYLNQEEHLFGVIDLVSTHLRDARLLNNIINEFYIYKGQQKKQSKDGDCQLFALVVYKNLHPHDFDELRLRKRGSLANALDQKAELMQTRESQIESKITEIETQVNKAQEEQLQSEKELRQLFMAYIMREAFSRYSGNITNVSLTPRGSTSIPLMKIDDEENFQKLLSAPSFSMFSRYANDPREYKLESAKAAAYGNVSYEERVRRLAIKAGIEEKNEQISALKKERLVLKQKSLQTLLLETQPKLEESELKPKEGESETQCRRRILITELLRAGYITEDYADYISLFHDGSISPSDYLFVRNVRLHESTRFDYELIYPKEVVKELDIVWYSQWQILNFYLMDALLKFFPNSEKCESVLSMLKQYTNESINFISEYVYVEKGQYGKLIKMLCADNKNLFWKAIQTSTLEESIKQHILKTIIVNAEEDDIVSNLEDSVEYVATMSKIFTWSPEGERLRNVAKRLKVHFIALDEETDKGFITFVFENNLFAITKSMFERVVPEKYKSNTQYNIANYTFLHQEKLDSLVQYLDSHIEEYVQNVLLEMPDNKQEETKYEYKLLNNADLSTSSKEKLIEKGKIIWESARQWGDMSDEVRQMLYKYDRVKISWYNVIELYDLNEDAFVDYIQREHIIKELQQEGVPTIEDIEVRKSWELLQTTIVSNKSLAEVAKQLAGCFDMAFDKSIIEQCNEDLLRVLLDHGEIKCGVDEYSYLRGLNRDLSMTLFATHFDDYKESIFNIEFDDKDFERVFDDKYQLSDEQKLYLLECFDAEDILNPTNALRAIDFLLQPSITAFDTTTEEMWSFIYGLLRYPEVETIKRIQLFNKFKHKNYEELDRMVSSFDARYQLNGHLHRMPYSEEAYKMCSYLKEKNYLHHRQRNHRGGFISVSYPRR